MTHFAALRAKLPPEAFALGPETDPEPTDPVDKPTWGGIVHLPDDVSLRTAEHHGSLLKSAYDIWGNWVSLVLDVQGLQGEPANDPLAAVMLDAGDEIQASTYAALTGFYRQAIGGLRPVVEGMLTGAYFRALRDQQRFDEWIAGGREGQMWVRDMRQKLAHTTPYEQFERPDRSLMAKDGWINDLYQRLSGFSHGRPYHQDDAGNKVPTTNGALWQSNGPIYEPRAFDMWSKFFMDSVLLAVVLTGLAEPRLLTLHAPQDLPFSAFLSNLTETHPRRNSVVEPIAQYLTR